MQRSSLIGHVVELHDLVLTRRQPADTTVREFLRKRHYLGARDRRYIQEALFGMLRHAIFLRETLLASRSDKEPDLPSSSLPTYVAHALRIEHEQPEALIPAVRGLWAVFCSHVLLENFITNVLQSDPLRKYEGNPARQLAIRESFPVQIVEEWEGRFGLEETQRLCESLNAAAPTTIRVNTLRCSREVCADGLRHEGIDTRKTKFSPDGLVLEKRVNASALNTFRNGYFEMQDEGSQVIGFLNEALPGMTIVDACAGGGGKAIHMANLIGNEGRVIALHQDARQLRETQERARRSDARIESYVLDDQANVMEMLNAAADVVLIDAPCSGVGVFRRSPWSKLTFTNQFSADLSRIQAALLDRFARCVRPGGRLVYATCTLLQKENEDVVNLFLKGNQEFKVIPIGEILVRNQIPLEDQSDFLTLLPHKTNTDGFFAAVLSRS